MDVLGKAQQEEEGGFVSEKLVLTKIGSKKFQMRDLPKKVR